MKLIQYVYATAIVLSVASCANVHSRKISNSIAGGELLVGVPVGWGGTSWDPDAVIAGLDRANPHNGDVSFTFLSENAYETELTQFNQVIEAGNYAGNKVRFQAYVKTQNVAGRAGLWMRADSKTRRAVAFDNMRKRKISGTTDWQLYAIVLDIPKEAVAIHFGILIEGSGQVWIDDCSLDIVNDDVMATAPKCTSTARGFVAPARMLKYPSNLGFEAKSASD